MFRWWPKGVFNAVAVEDRLAVWKSDGRTMQRADTALTNPRSTAETHFRRGLGVRAGRRLGGNTVRLSWLKQRSVKKSHRVASASFGLLKNRRLFSAGD